MNRYLLPFLFLFLFFKAISQPIVELEPFTTQSIGQIVGIISSGDDRLHAVIQSGIIRIIEPDGTVRPEPFLDITSRVQSGGERGLLGLAFHPDFPENKTFYLNYTRAGNATVISRWQIEGDDINKGDELSEEILLIVDQPFANHNGGDLRFGPDGYLYIGLGDGGSGNDPQNRSQNPMTPLGKMLRIDVNVSGGYLNPADNPFVMTNDTLDEIWALGLRNPWRFSFDRLTGDLWIADVGQNAVEEINKVGADSKGGENYGWRCYEGTRPNILTGCQSEDHYVFPVHEYTHGQGDRSITGGFIYRGSRYPDLDGYYIYADFVSSRFFTLKESEGEYLSETLGTLGLPSPATFGEDANGELYVASYFSGTISRVVDFCQAYTPWLEYDEANGDMVVVLESGNWGANTSIEWYLDGVLIEGASDTRLNQPENGTYTVRVVHSRGCDKISEPYFLMISSVSDSFWPKELKIWPNPSQGTITFESKLPIGIDFQLIDFSGKVLESVLLPSSAQMSHKFQVVPGMYILRGQLSDGQAIHQKIVIQ